MRNNFDAARFKGPIHFNGQYEKSWVMISGNDFCRLCDIQKPSKLIQLI